MMLHMATSTSNFTRVTGRKAECKKIYTNPLRLCVQDVHEIWIKLVFRLESCYSLECPKGLYAKD